MHSQTTQASGRRSLCCSATACLQAAVHRPPRRARRPAPLSAALVLATLWVSSGCDALCGDDCPSGQRLEGTAQDLDTALRRAPGQDEPVDLVGAILGGPTTCGTTTWVEVTGTGSARFTDQGNPPPPRPDARPPDPADPGAAPDDAGITPTDAGPGATDAAPPGIDRATWIRTHLSPLVAGASPYAGLGVFSAGFGLLRLDACPSASGVTVYVETYRWPAVAPVAEHIAAALAAEDLGETVHIRVSDEVVICPQKACGY